MEEFIELKVPVDVYKRLVKMVDSYETNRMKTRKYAQKKLDEQREAFNKQVLDAGLEKLVRKSRKKEDPFKKVIKIQDYVIGQAPDASPRGSSEEDCE